MRAAPRPPVEPCSLQAGSILRSHSRADDLNLVGDTVPPKRHLYALRQDRKGNRRHPGMGYFAANDFNVVALITFSSVAMCGSDGRVTIDARCPQRRNVAAASQPMTQSISMPAMSHWGLCLRHRCCPPRCKTLHLGWPQPFNSRRLWTGNAHCHRDHIDIGNLSLQNIGSARLDFADHGVCGDGTDIAGDLYIRAAQVYPVTGTTFTIAAHNHGGNSKGSVTFETLGLNHLPLSAGGMLNAFCRQHHPKRRAACPLW